MLATVVNIRGTKNSEGQISDPDVVYVGRTFNMGGWRLVGSKFNNPISSKIGKRNCIIEYIRYLYEILEDEHIREEFLSLRGKTLGCWCHPEMCHGHVIAYVLNNWKPTISNTLNYFLNRYDEERRVGLASLDTTMIGAYTVKELTKFLEYLNVRIPNKSKKADLVNLLSNSL